MFRNPPDQDMRALLVQARTIAVLGLSPKTARPSHRVARRLQGWGYRVIPVRPAVSEVLGERAYPRLEGVPERIDIVNVFRAAGELDAVVQQCIELRLPAIWIQLGIVNEPAAERAREAGMFVVMDRCISVERSRLLQAA